MERPRARPRFTLELAQSPETITEKVRHHLALDGSIVTGSVFRRTVLLTIVDARRHFWTPHLDVQLDERAGGGTRLSATISPHPQLWTLFVGIQLLFGLLSVGAAVWLTSQWMLGGALLTPTLILAAMLFGGGFSYGAAYVGQGFGSEQMYELRSFLDGALREGEQ